MKAIVVQGKGDAKLVDNVKEPSLRPDYVKVKTVAVALNPTDWKSIDNYGNPGSIVGCDFSGIVEEVGANVKSDVKKGDRICGFVHGSNGNNHEDGGFAEYLVVKDGIFLKVPSSMSMEDAATFGVAIGTNAQAMYQTLKLPLPTQPTEKPFPLLIYGGSTATGTVAIQLAKLSGLEVITTASPSNFELLKSRGADAVFDYKESDVSEKIRNFTDDKLKYVYDTISLPASVAICAAAFSTTLEQKGKYTALLKVEDFPHENVESTITLAYTCIGEGFKRGDFSLPPSPDDYEYAAMFFKLAEKLIAEGKVLPHPSTVGPNGLNGVLDGLQQMREDNVRGTKLVYRIADTA